MNLKQFLICINLLNSLSKVVDCNLCSYEYNFQPVDSYLCNLSCNCSIEIVCSAALMQKNTSSTKATIRWYALNITSNTALLINEEQLVTEKIINDHIMSSLVIPRINKKEQFTEYWCTIEDPTYKGIFKKSNIFTVVEEHNVSNCTKSVELQYRWNKTCAVLSVNASNDEGTESSGIELVVISCVGTFISIVIFLTVIAVYCILHFKAKVKTKVAFERYCNNDIYSEATEIIEEHQVPSHIAIRLSSTSSIC